MNKRCRLIVTLLGVEWVTLQACSFYPLPAAGQREAEAANWKFYLASCERDIGLVRIFGLTLPPLFRHPLDAAGIARVRGNLLTAVDRAQKTIPPLYAVSHKDAADDLEALGTVQAYIVNDQFAAARAAHQEGKALLPLLKDTEADSTKMLTLWDKCFGKDSSRIEPFRQALGRVRQRIEQLEKQR